MKTQTKETTCNHIHSVNISFCLDIEEESREIICVCLDCNKLITLKNILLIDNFGNVNGRRLRRSSLKLPDCIGAGSYGYCNKCTCKHYELCDHIHNKVKYIISKKSTSLNETIVQMYSSILQIMEERANKRVCFC